MCRKYKQNKEEDSGVIGDNEDTFEVVDRDTTFETLLQKCSGEKENDKVHKKNLEEHLRYRKLYDSVIELTDAMNEEEREDRISEERMEELNEEIRKLSEGEIVVEDLNSTRDILNSVVANGVDYMEEE